MTEQSDNANVAPDEATLTPLELPPASLLRSLPSCSWLLVSTPPLCSSSMNSPWGGGDAGEGGGCY